MRRRQYSVIAALAAAGVLVSESSPAGVKCRHERNAGGERVHLCEHLPEERVSEYSEEDVARFKAGYRDEKAAEPPAIPAESEVAHPDQGPRPDQRAGQSDAWAEKFRQADESNMAFARERFLRPNRATRFKPVCDEAGPANQKVERIWVKGEFAVGTVMKEPQLLGANAANGPAGDRVLKEIEGFGNLFPHWKTKVDGKGLYTTELAEELELAYTSRQVSVREKGKFLRSGFVWPSQRAEVDHVALLTVLAPLRPVCVTAKHIGNVYASILDESVRLKGRERVTGLRLTGKGADSYVGVNQVAGAGDILIEGFAEVKIHGFGNHQTTISIVGRPGARTKVEKLMLIGSGHIYLENVDLGELWVYVPQWRGELHLKNTSVGAYHGPSFNPHSLSMHEEGGELHFSLPASGAATR